MSKTNKMSKDERLKSLAIMHAVEVKSSFSLYAYRIISHEVYVQRITELVQIFTKELKNVK